MNENWPLPYGWIEQVDSNSGHTYYVDTRATPPRSIWTHPYEDDRYLSEHPDVREKVRASGSSSLQTPSVQSRRHSYNGQDSGRVYVPPTPKQGFFAKMKQKAEKSMEEHNERKREQLIAMQEARQRAYEQRVPMSGGMYGSYAAPTYAYPQSRYGMMGQRRGGMGGMGMALPMLGGLAGGMIIGDALGDGFGGGGDWGGGGFGGDFGGGGGGFF